MNKLNLHNKCRIAYCPGCNFIARSAKDKMILPALVIDGIIVSHSSFPTEETVRK